jgi:hypothetical protein
METVIQNDELRTLAFRPLAVPTHRLSPTRGAYTNSGFGRYAWFVLNLPRECRKPAESMLSSKSIRTCFCDGPVGRRNDSKLSPTRPEATLKLPEHRNSPKQSRSEFEENCETRLGPPTVQGLAMVCRIHVLCLRSYASDSSV